MDSNVREWCRNECIRQHATTDFDFSNMERAWVMAKRSTDLELPLDIDLIRMLAGRIDPHANPAGRFRTGPAVFMNGGTACPAWEIPDRLEDLFNMWETFFIDEAEDFYQHLMWIHPMKDGNGRLGALVYNILNGTINNPVVPPEYR